MKKTVLLLSVIVSCGVLAGDWTTIFGTGGGAQQQAPQQQFNWGNWFGGQQPQAQQPVANEAQPGFFESISVAVKVAQDPEVKALMEAKMNEYANLGFFERMSKVMNDPALKALIDAKMSGKRTIMTQPQTHQQPESKAQQGFDWSSLFGGNKQSVPQQQTQQGGFDWSTLFGAGQQKQAPEQQPQTQQGGFGQMLMKLLENAQQQPQTNR